MCYEKHRVVGSPRGESLSDGERSAKYKVRLRRRDTASLDSPEARRAMRLSSRVHMQEVCQLVRASRDAAKTLRPRVISAAIIPGEE